MSEPDKVTETGSEIETEDVHAHRMDDPRTDDLRTDDLRTDDLRADDLRNDSAHA